MIHIRGEMFGNETLLSSVCKKIFHFQGNRCKITWGTGRRAEDDISQHVFVPQVPVFISNQGAVRWWCAGIELTPPPRPIHGGTCKDARPFRWRWLITARGVPAKVVLGAEEGQGYQEKTQVLLMRSEYHKTYVLPAPVASCGVLGVVQLKENNLARRLLG